MDKNLRKNITLIYILNFIFKTHLWWAVWLLYYRSFTDYKGVGIIQAIMIITSILTEIPSGAIADLLGRKKTLIIAFLFAGSGEIIVGLLPNMTGAIVGVTTLALGYSLFSGTMEALLYDSLLKRNKESTFPRIIGRFTTLGIVATAVGSISGSLLFKLGPGFPNIAAGMLKISCIVFALFLTEPEINSAQFSIKNYLKQNTRGFKAIFQKSILPVSILSASFGIFYKVRWEVLDDALIVDYGYSDLGIGVFYAVMAVVSAVFSVYYDKISKRFNPLKIVYICAIVFIVTFLITPLTGFITGSILLLIRAIFDGIFENASLESVNSITKSRDRATAISTFNMVNGLPYALFAIQIGGMMDTIGVKSFALFYGLILGAISIPQMLFIYFRKRNLFDTGGLIRENSNKPH